MKWTAMGAVLLLFPLAHAEPFLQPGFDAQRTGATADSGPAALDVALRVALPGLWDLVTHVSPLILEGRAYVVVAGQSGVNSGGPVEPTDGGLYGVDLDTAEVTALASLSPDDAAGAFVSDGHQLFLTHGGDAISYDLKGTESWRTPIAAVEIHTNPNPVRSCVGAIEDAYYVACIRGTAAVPSGGNDAAAAEEIIVARFDLTSGDAGGLYVGDAVTQLGASQRLDALSGLSPGMDAAVPPDALLWLDDVVLGPHHVVVLAKPLAVQPGTLSRSSLWFIERDTMELAWGQSMFACGQFDDPESQTGQNLEYYGNWGSAVVARQDSFLYLEADLMDQPWAWDDDNWCLDLPGRPFTSLTGGLAVRGDVGFAAHPDGVTRVDLAGPGAVWTLEIPGWTPGTDDQALLSARQLFVTGEGTLHVIDPEAGLKLATLGPALLFGNANAMAIGDGVLAVQTSAGLTVIGTTAASIELRATANVAYPRGGEEVRIDATASRPGIQAPDLEFSVDWGDGSNTEWQTDHVFTHTYFLNGDKDARLFARNTAGQTASQTFVFHVDGTPPNFISTAFDPDHQEATFFLLGIVLLLIGSAFGVVRLRTKRRRLRRELAAADRIVADERDHPDRLRERLRGHRLRARRLFLDGRLDEGSTSILERHCDELLRGHRLAGVEQAFGFLPHQLFRGLQEILTDARVSDWERRQFLESLSKDGKLTASERKRVTQRVEQWHREDAA